MELIFHIYLPGLTYGVRLLGHCLKSTYAYTGIKYGIY